MNSDEYKTPVIGMCVIQNSKMLVKLEQDEIERKLKNCMNQNALHYWGLDIKHGTENLHKSQYICKSIWIGIENHSDFHKVVIYCRHAHVEEQVYYTISFILEISKYNCRTTMHEGTEPLMLMNY